MGRGAYDSSESARAVFEEADAALGESLSTLCFEGPEDELVRTEVLDRFSHTLLNGHEAFAQRVPTAENIAGVVHEALAAPLSARTSAELVAVRLVETRRNWFDTGVET